MDEPLARDPRGPSYGGINEEAWARAVQVVRDAIPEADRVEIAARLAKDGERSLSEVHFGFGSEIRNLLRRKRLDESALGVMDLDSAWSVIVAEAVAED